MNERIKELWSQAEEEIKAEYEDESRRNRRLYNEIFLPKFAELIVRECLELTLGKDRKQLLDKGDLNGANLLQKDIVRVIKHFGVEE